MVEENGQGVLSSDSSATIKLEPKGPVNGGLKAWIQILGAFFLYFNTWGKSSGLNPLPPHCLQEGGSAQTNDDIRDGVELWKLSESLRGLISGQERLVPDLDHRLSTVFPHGLHGVYCWTDFRQRVFQLSPEAWIAAGPGGNHHTGTINAILAAPAVPGRLCGLWHGLFGCSGPCCCFGMVHHQVAVCKWCCCQCGRLWRVCLPLPIPYIPPYMYLMARPQPVCGCTLTDYCNAESSTRS